MSNLNERLSKLSPEKRELLLKKLKKQAPAKKSLRILPRKNRNQFPISSSQMRLWFLQQLEPDSAFYNIPSAIRISGKPDMARFKKSIREVVSRHEVLRAFFTTNDKGEPEQHIVPNLIPKFPITDLTSVPADQVNAQVQRLLRDEAGKPFNLAEPPLFRMRLFKINDAEYVLSVNMHHIIADGWSIGVFINEIMQYYRLFSAGDTKPPEPLHLQYADYAQWQIDRATDDALNKQLEYWKDKLAGMPDTLDLYTDYPRPELQTFNGKQFIFRINQTLSEKLKELSRADNVSLYAFLMSAFQVFLHKISGQQDFGVGAPIANRNRAEIETLIGFFVNTIVLRAHFEKDILFSELVQRVKNDIVSASDNQDIPFEKIVETVGSGSQLSRSPLFQVMFDLQQLPFETLEQDNLKIEIVDIEIEVAKFDLLLLMLERNNGIQCTFEYNTDLFSPATIRRYARYFQTLLESITANPQTPISKLTLVSQKEQLQMLNTWNRTQTEYPRQVSVVELFEKQVEKTPEAIAIEYDDAILNYKELNRRANQLAHFLLQKGIQPGDFVALYMEQSIEMICGFLAILKTGAAYAPLDISYPKERIRIITEDTKASILLTKSSLLDQIPEIDTDIISLDDESEKLSEYSTDNPAIPIQATDRAYIIYTSGSTGKPKGVVVPHRAINRLVKNTDYMQIEADHSIAQASNAAFDAATFEIWGALLNGAKLCNIPKETMLSAMDFADILKKKNISHIFITTALFNQIAGQVPNAFEHLDTVMFGGEQVDPPSVRKIIKAKPPKKLLHVYGPTENTTFSTWYQIKRVGQKITTIPIGKPIANSTCYVLDQYLNPVPVGIPGELYVGGDGVALEYLNRSDLTAERFIPNPLPHSFDSILYKTGDLVRYLSDGNIEFLARMDQQVKIRGFRIELGEIESLLKTAPAIKDAAVIVREDTPGDKQITAYYVSDGTSIQPRALRTFLLETLPEYMIPVVFMELDAIPLTPNGKVDRKALPIPQKSRSASAVEFVAPRNKLESYLANAWRDILSIDKIGVKDNFFELGGNSLKAAVFINRIQKDFNESTPVSAIFKAPTIHELAGYIVNYFPDRAKELFDYDESWNSWYKIIHVDDEVVHKIDQNKIETIREIIQPLPPKKADHSPKNPPAVFVLSPPRSGSTLLRIMLAGNKKLFSPPELDLLSFNTLRERREAFSEEGLEIWLEATIRAIKELKQTDVDEARRIMDSFVAQDMTVKEYYRTLQEWMGDRILVDKSPTYPFDPEILNRAEQDFGQAKYIHLLRHPYAMVYSFIEAKLDQNFFRYKHPFTRRELAELIYIISHQNINRFLQKIPDERKMLLRFEDLLLDPYNEMLRICDFLNIEFDPDMLNPYQGNKMTDGVSKHSQMVGDFKFYLHKNIDTSVTDRWRAHHKIDFLSDITWELAKNFGYPVEKQIAHSQTTAIQQIPVVPRDGELPLSFAQQRLWFLDQMEPGNPQYNIPGAIRLNGTLNIELMKQALNLVVERHEILRTIFRSSEEGKATQLILPHIELDLPIENAAGLSDDALIKRANQESAKAFDLSKAPLLRAKLFRISDQDHILMIVMHHIISDGWSVNVLVRELSLFYNALVKNETAPLPPLKIQYADFASWQRHWLRGSILEAEMAFWKTQLEGASFFLELPTDFPRPKMVSYQGKRLVQRIPDSLYQKLNQLGKEHEATLFMILLAAFETLLYRYSGQEDFTIGTPVANRNRSEIEPLIGFFVNTLVLRSSINSERSFRHHLRLVKKIAMDALDHQDMPFEKLVDTLQPEREMNHTPLFQVMFSMQRSDIQEMKLEGLSYRPFAIETETAKFDLNLEIVEHTNRMVAIFEYKTSLFKEETIQRMMTHFTTLLETISRDPDQNIAQLPMLNKAEQKNILKLLTAPKLEYPQTECLHQSIEKQAEQHPDWFAVGLYGQSLTFAQLNRRANRLAHFLIEAGVKPESIVAILMERSIDMIVSMLAIWKTGCAYLPLDPAYPAERIQYMLEDAKVPVLITHKTVQPTLTGTQIQTVFLDTDQTAIESKPMDNPEIRLSSNNLAYIIYTSGSTGKPKGVMITHQSAQHLAANLQQSVYDRLSGEPLKISLNAPIPFDASMQQIVMLTRGHGLQIIPLDVRAEGASMLTYLRDHKIQVLDCVPSQLKLMLEAGLTDENQWKPLAVLPGGEAIDEITWQQLVQCKDILFFNMYGPTECTVDSTICDVRTSPDRPVIGKPVHNARFYILDPGDQPVPTGVAGELYIAGDGLARGYLNRPELTFEKFISDPFVSDPDARMYKSGDLVRCLPDGNIEFLGRVDQQVKIRGFRIELGEIESALQQHEHIKDAVIIAKEIKPGDKRLIAYLIQSDNAFLNISDLRSYLKQSLPEYMVPAAFVTLETFPLLPNGKINRKALPDPEFDRNDLGTEFVEARSDKEIVLAGIWKAVLGIDKIGIKDNFFELGGDSILSIQVIARAKQKGLQITPRQLFENPTIEALALVAEQGVAIHAEQGLVSGPFPATPIQQHFFEQNYVNAHHWNQSVMLKVAQSMTPEILEQVVAKVIEHHDALRLRVNKKEQDTEVYIGKAEPQTPFSYFDFSDEEPAALQKAIEQEAEALQAGLHLQDGPIIRVAYFKLPEGESNRLLIVVHHLAIDGVSWRILTEDIQLAFAQAVSGQPITLPPKSTSFKYWAEQLATFAKSELVRNEYDYWKKQLKSEVPSIPVDDPLGNNREKNVQIAAASLNSEETSLLLNEANQAYNTQINELMIAALVKAYKHWSGNDALLLALEGHGREDILDDVDISRTVGWFTSLFPAKIDLKALYAEDEIIRQIKEQLRSVPQKGLGFGLLRYLSGDPAIKKVLSQQTPQMVFNYLGQFGQQNEESRTFEVVNDLTGSERALNNSREFLLDISSSIKSNELHLQIAYSTELFRDENIHNFLSLFLEELRNIISHCVSVKNKTYTPSDFTDVELEDDEISDLLDELE